MPAFIIHINLATESSYDNQKLEKLDKELMEYIRSKFPKIKWSDVKIIGPFEYIESFHAPDMATANDVAKQIRAYGNAQVEVWEA